MPDVPTLHAWVDESVRSAGNGLTENTYLLAATVADPAGCDSVRETLGSLLLGRARRLHWNDEGASRRRVIATALRESDVTHTVVIGAPVDSKRQERARRLCLERLLFELAALGVSRVWVESRTQSLNTRDQTMIAALRSRQSIPGSLLVEFALPTEEPMLWFADIVAGAIGLHRRREDSKPYEWLRQQITEHDIRLT